MELYQNELTPTSRAVFLCAKALGIDLKLIRIDIKTRENRGEEYAKVGLLTNPLDPENSSENDFQ
jgi:glutathione S-transferase